jgi:predicted nucleic-acid-binding protein
LIRIPPLDAYGTGFLASLADLKNIIRHSIRSPQTGRRPRTLKSKHPSDLAARTTAYLSSEEALLLADLVVAETVYVLESLYETPGDQVAQAVRSLVAFESVVCVDPALLLRAVEVYEIDRLDFAEAYLVACAETTGVGRVVSFDQSIDRVDSVERIEPPTP